MNTPQQWPAGFIYTRTSVLSGLQPFLLQLILTTDSPGDSAQIVPLIDLQHVHPDIRLQMITHPSHPLINITTKRGDRQRGVFATHKISAGTVLGEYVGEIYLVWEKDDLEDLIASRQPFSDYAWIGRYGNAIVIIDAQRFANELAFVNDYRGLQNHPNVRPQWIFHRGRSYFVYISTRDIHPNEELLIKYGEREFHF